ncbi:MAG TPA: sodium:solute symporter, partial [Hyphomicrobiaceae bacterium]|nr:sodium:solute symporter [Hyphomicrobiaceae bacterium]
MPVARRQALVNPRLGIYASIVAGVLASLVLVLLIVEELGGGQAGVGLGTWLGLGILALFAAIALATLSSSAHDYFVAGRRVPAGFNGLVLGMSLFGGTGAVALTGALFLGGFDV